MRFEQYGDRNGKTLMLLHGMATTGHECFDRVIPFLKNYHVILCEVDGHYTNSTFKSLNDCCEQIEEYVRRNYDGKLYGLLGFSMGGSISVRLMDWGNIQVEKVILDAAFCVKMGVLTPVFRSHSAGQSVVSGRGSEFQPSLQRASWAREMPDI